MFIINFESMSWQELTLRREVDALNHTTIRRENVASLMDSQLGTLLILYAQSMESSPP